MPKSNPDLALAMASRMIARRKELNLTQEKVAELAGIAHQQYNKAERGKTCVGSDTLLRISQALDISADFLLHGSPHNSTDRDIILLIDSFTDEQKELAISMLRTLSRYDVKLNKVQP